MDKIQINGAQALALIGVLQDHVDGEPVLLIERQNGELAVSFNLTEVTIEPSGEVAE